MNKENIQELVETYLKRVAFEGPHDNVDHQKDWNQRWKLDQYYSYEEAKTISLSKPSEITNEKLWSYQYLIDRFTDYSKRTIWLSQKETESEEDHISVIRFLWDRMHQYYNDGIYQTYSIGTSRDAFIFPETPVDILKKCLSYKSGWKRVHTAVLILENVNNPGKILMKQFQRLTTEVTLDTNKYCITFRQYNHKTKNVKNVPNQPKIDLRNKFLMLYKEKKEKLTNDS